MFLHAAADWLTLAQDAVPRMDDIYWLLLASRVLHILGSIVLVGGVFYLRMIVAPRLRASDADAGSDAWFAGRRGTWAMWVGIATLLLLVTGLFNYLQIINANQKLPGSYHMIAGIKMLVALVVFLLAALLAGRSTAAESFRQKMKFWLSLCLLAGVLVVLLGSVLRSYPREPKLLDDGPQLIAPAAVD